MKNLSSYEQIDVLKFVNFDQLFSIQQTNYYFNLLIEQNKWILALKELHRISIYILDEDHDNMIDQSNILYYPIDDELLTKWQSAMDKQIPLYVFNDLLETPFDIYIALSNRGNHFVLKLPKYPKNIEEMQIIYFWLEQLFRCSFEKAELYHLIFNPEMINLFFGNNKNIKFNIQAIDNYPIYFLNSSYKNILKFIFDHLIITKEMKINFHCIDNVEKQHNIILKLLLNSGRSIYCVLIEEFKETSKLFNLIINHIKMSTTLFRNCV